MENKITNVCPHNRTEAEQDLLDKAYLADQFVAMRRCRLCNHLTAKMYICMHCERDDDAEDEDED